MKQEENKRKRKADLKKDLWKKQEKELKTMKIKLLDKAVKDTVAIDEHLNLLKQ